jgi:RNA polymerase sigma factor (sigma-70 family)
VWWGETEGGSVAVAPSHFDDAPHVAELLYRQHAAALHAFCRGRVGPDDADEVVQTTFLRALRALNRGERPFAERAWLLTIARNVCVTRATSAAWRHEQLDPDAVEIQAPAPVDDGVDAELIDALAALPDGQRRAFVLRAVHELSYDEIAAELGVSHAAVESWIFRARRKLALTVGTGRRRLALDASSLAGVLKSLVPGGAAKVAVAAAVVGTAVVAGPTIVDRNGPDSSRPSRAEPVENAGPAVAERARPKQQRRVAARTSTKASDPTPRTGEGPAVGAAIEPAEPTLPPATAPDPTTAPAEANGELPVATVPLPAVELPEVQLPKLELPLPLEPVTTPTVELPPLTPSLP